MHCAQSECARCCRPAVARQTRRRERAVGIASLGNRTMPRRAATGTAPALSEISRRACLVRSRSAIQVGPQPSAGELMPQLTTEIVGEMCSTAADPPPAAIMTMMDSPLEGAVMPAGAAPGGFIVLTIAPVAAVSAMGGATVAAVTLRTP